MEEKEQQQNEPRRRIPLKNIHHSNWKNKLRNNCLNRVQADRDRLLWNYRKKTTTSPSSSSTSADLTSLTSKEIMDFTFRDIVSDELKKIKDSAFSVSVSVDDDDVIWEYDGLQNNSQSVECEWEEIMIEMQRIFYEDLRAEEYRREIVEFGGALEEEDEYLAEAAFNQLQLNSDQTLKTEVWCPICKRGELKEDHNLIYCTHCKLQLSRGDEVNLDILRSRLAEAHTDHLDRGCRLAPKFCMETRFSLTALYIQCEACGTFEIVL